MQGNWLKSLLVAVLALFFVPSFANDHEEKTKLDPAKLIMEHIQDAHEFHFFTLEKKDGSEFHATIPLPVIIYSNTKGISIFSSSNFHHGHASFNGYVLEEGKIHAEDPKEKIIDLSITKNVVQMLLALTLLVSLMVGIANKYKKGQGVQSAPKGWQNAIEPVITFVRDEVAKPNLA
ncbi:MAG: F0F1 ATP synthase subunit A, partial [Chitinophagia bacterium]|nr:F0F1 ATP synthase subunit A [Chitinophagia bacterium]